MTFPISVVTMRPSSSFFRRKIRAASRCRGLPPSLERAFRRANGVAQLFLRRGGERGQDFARGRVDRLEPLAFGFLPFPADEEAVLLNHRSSSSSQTTSIR